MRKRESQEERKNRVPELRDRAEEKLARTPGASREIEEKTPAKIIHELQVHHIELEMQNEELRRTQLALEESRGKYIDLYDFAPVGYFTLTDKSLITEVNLTGAALLGVARQKLTNGRFRRFIAPEGQGLWDHHLLRVLKGEEKQTCDLLLRRADGSTFPARLESVRLAASGGVPVVRMVVSDNTERKNAEALTVEAHKRLLTVLDSIDAAVYVADMDTYELLFMNKYGRELFGDSAERKCWEVLQAGQQGPCPFCTNDKLLCEDKTPGNVYIWEFQNTKNGNWYECRDQAIFWTKGRLARLEIATNITEHKRLEAEHLRMTQLESLGMVAAGIAHDFNNLLQGLLGNISMAKLYLKPEDRSYKFLGEAENVYESARQLTGQLLTFSTGGAPVRKIFDINKLIREWSEFVLSGSNVACDLQMPAISYQVEADDAQIRQVVQNLLINVREAMPAGGIVTIRTERIYVDDKTSLPLAKGPYVRMSVADRGVGIPKNNLERVFEPYFSTKDKNTQKGMGLGLAICQSIIKRHYGYILVESAAGEGTTFTVYLPLSEKELLLNEPVGTEKPLISGKTRLLFMDDEKSLSRVMKQYLELKGFEVVVTSEGRETIKAYREAREQLKCFDVVILDLTIPGGMGGIETVRELLRIDATMKAIVSSGYSDDPAMNDFGAYGFQSALIKPYTMERLEEVIGKVIGESAPQLA